ncbi:MAG: transposase [Verrucomicrobiota bacterium]|nr:transposase [Verrucomicrobiota bacterium]
MTKRELTDSQWEKIRPHLPEPKRSRRGGRPPADNRACFEGILWVLRSGARWKDLPEDFPSPSTCWRRLRDWEDAELWLHIWRIFLGELDAAGRLDWEETFADGSFAPAKKGALASEKPNAARVRSGWWWQTAKVFLWEFTSTRPPPTKSRSSRKR